MINNLHSRRSFLKGTSLATGGILLSLQLPDAGRTRAAFAASGPAPFIPNAFVKIDDQGVTLIMPHTEVGQGIYTSSAMMMAEELELDLDQVKVEAAPPDMSKYMDPNLYDQATGGSMSTRSDWMRLRQAAAAARIMMVSAAAARWKVDPSTLTVERGIIHNPLTKAQFTFAEIAPEAATQAVPTDIKLKEPSEFRLIGTRARRVDTATKVNGAAIYGIDIRRPGMKFATLAMSPVKGGTIASMDEKAGRAIPGVVDIVRSGNDAIAVIAEHMWAAKQGLDALAITWDNGPNGTVTLESIVAKMDEASKVQGVVIRNEKSAEAAIEKAKTKLSAIYQSPFLSHAPLEPLNCTLHIRADGAELWVGTQVPVRAQKAVADAIGLAPEKVVVHNQLMGGAFGRRLDVDSIEIAAKLLKDIRYPVKMVWTREQDMTHDYYRPYYYDRVAAGLDDSGKLAGRTHRVTGSSIYARWAAAAFKNGIDPDAVDCAAETPYDEDAVLADYVRQEPDGMNTSWWRGVGPTHNVFVIESFVDEMANATRQDPLEFRRRMLGRNPRALAVLNLAAEKAGWGQKLPKGRGQGISLQFAFGSYLAHILEIDVAADGSIGLIRSVIAVDCGITINPDTVLAQMQGGIIFGLSAAMFNRITLTDGAVDQTNFDTYRVMRINEVPKVEVYQIHNNEAPGGVGEAATAAAAGALANAIFAATGKRFRSLPLADAMGA
ncbi:molybdopterin cofactor-binding domain-containing protein [Rhizobium sp. SSA_523]|uniref:xanthine dehydrogenase family protein molybdopterin-binding subunit n=2 Tax=Rhizobium sp. SSA_523 TaxID=2952477 RepID=UPI0020915277|nr:molybdopterin cofactor-binding domain-containing protein [Rhizobium sp. SSA_523]MCO5734465.1 molybdopterin-dependent oxidoreductase [Rhizobium sp. SSA_523]WKC25765.1 molybdopterin-dependent oxidoreductase [Rhizobium sp. SSA_523]